MIWSRWAWQIDRRTSSIFVPTVVGVVLAMSWGRPAEWAYVLPLPAPFVLLPIGGWLAVQPCLARAAHGART